MNQVLLEDFQEIYLITAAELECFRETKWLITGVTGMLGSYLLAFLAWLNNNHLAQSMCITAIHRSSFDETHPILGELLADKQIEFRSIDLAKDFSLNSTQYDYIVHAASNAAPRTYLADPISTMNANVKATQMMLDQIVPTNNQLKAFLYVSSGEIYGNVGAEDVPTKETYLGLNDHLDARACYVEAKRFAETLCRNYYKQYHLPITMIRPIHIFGPGFRLEDSRVWADFISKAVTGQNIEILSDGLGRRGFCYLADALSQILRILLSGQTGEVYNIGNDQHVSVRELAEIVAAKAGKKPKIFIKNELPAYLQGSPHISCPSIEKVAGLGPLLSTSLEEAVARSIRYCEALIR